MKNKRKHRKEHLSNKVRILSKIYLGLILFMFAVVIYDSFFHELPFYYILFLLGGFITGRMVTSFTKFYILEDEKMLTFQSTPVGILLLILLLVIRFAIGKFTLKQFDVIWTADALYLFFIGIYYAKMKNIIRQLDKRVYHKLFEKN